MAGRMAFLALHPGICQIVRVDFVRWGMQCCHRWASSWGDSLSAMIQQERGETQMRLSCNQRELLESINAVMPATAGPAFPALSNILFEAAGDGLALTAYNTEIAVEKRIPAAVAEPGQCMLPGKTIADVTRKLGPGDIEMESENGKVRMRWSASRFEFWSMDAGQFPKIPWETGNLKKVSGSQFADAITRTLFAASKNEYQGILAGVCFCAGGKVTDIVAIDGVRLAKAELPSLGIEGQKTVPVDALRAALRAFAKAEVIRLGFGERAMTIEGDNTRILARLLEGQFPQYQQIVPNPSKMRLTISRQELLDAVARISIVSEEGVRLTAQDEGLHIAAKSETGQAEEHIDATCEGEKIALSMNHRFLSEAVTAATGENVILACDGPFTPVLITGDDPTWLSVVMPLRVE